MRVAFTTTEVAERTGLTRKQVLRLCHSGALGSVLAGRYILIPAKALDAFLGTESA